MDFVTKNPLLKGFRTDFALMDLQTRQQVSGNVRIVYLQLPLFNKHTEEECKDIFDCWIYIIKNMDMFEQMPFRDKYPVFRKLAQIGDLRKLSQEERALYDEDIKNMRDLYATNMFEIHQEKVETAKRSLGEGLAPELVAKITKLPLDEVFKLAQSN